MQENIKLLLSAIKQGDLHALARGITIIENSLQGSEQLLMLLENTHKTRVVGVTGPPGAGKSTLVNALLSHWLAQNKKIAVLAVDPSSPFNYGAILGDRIRMSNYYTHPGIFIRSLATRGALGGLNANIIEVTDLVKNAPFDIVVIETVGVGQSEVEIAGLADCTIVTLVPESGDEIQTLKAGIMEIADIFVVNKADRDAAETLYMNLKIMAHENAHNTPETPVIKTIATENSGIEELAQSIDTCLHGEKNNTHKHIQLLAEKCWQLVQAEKMKNINSEQLFADLKEAIQDPLFNIYLFAKKYTGK